MLSWNPTEGGTNWTSGLEVAAFNQRRQSSRVPGSSNINYPVRKISLHCTSLNPSPGAVFTKLITSNWILLERALIELKWNLCAWIGKHCFYHFHLGQLLFQVVDQQFLIGNHAQIDRHQSSNVSRHYSIRCTSFNAMSVKNTKPRHIFAFTYFPDSF